MRHTIKLGEKTSIITDDRDFRKAYSKYVQSVGSTELQPFVAVNFINGNPVGGRTMTEKEVEYTIKQVIERSGKEAIETT